MECSLTFNKESKQIIISSQTECKWSCVVTHGNITLQKYYGKLVEMNSYSDSSTVFTYNTHMMEGEVRCSFQNNKTVVIKNLLIEPTPLHVFYVNNKNVILFGEKTKTYVYVYYGTVDKNEQDVYKPIEIIINNTIIKYDGQYKKIEVNVNEDNDIPLYDVELQKYNDDLKFFEIIITSQCDVMFNDMIIIKGKTNNGDVTQYTINISQSMMRNVPTLLKIQPTLLFLDSNNPKQKVNVTSLYKGMVSDYEIQITKPLINNEQTNKSQDNLPIEEYLNGHSVIPYNNNGLDIESLVGERNASHFILDMSSCEEDDENIGDVAYELYVVNKKDKTKFSKLEFFYDNIFNPENFIEIVSVENVYAYTYNTKNSGITVYEADEKTNKINFKNITDISNNIQTLLTLYFTKIKMSKDEMIKCGEDIVFAQYNPNKNIIFTINCKPNWWRILSVSDNVREVKKGDTLLISLEKEIPKDLNDYITLQNRLGRTCKINLKSANNILQNETNFYFINANNEISNEHTFIINENSNEQQSIYIVSESYEREIYYTEKEYFLNEEISMIEIPTIQYEKDEINNVIKKTIALHSFNVLLNQDINKKYINYGSLTKNNNGTIEEIEDKDNNRFYFENNKVIIEIPYYSNYIPWNILNNDGLISFDIFLDKMDGKLIPLNELQPTFSWIEEDDMASIEIIFSKTKPKPSESSEEPKIYLVPKYSYLTQNTTLIFQQINTLKEIYLNFEFQKTIISNNINKYGTVSDLKNMTDLVCTNLSQVFDNLKCPLVQTEANGTTDIYLYYTSFKKENAFIVTENDNISFSFMSLGEKKTRNIDFNNTIIDHNTCKMWMKKWEHNVHLNMSLLFSEIKDNGIEITNEWKIKNGYLKIFSGNGESVETIFPENKLYQNDTKTQIIIKKNIISNTDEHVYYAIEFNQNAQFDLNGILYDLHNDDDGEEYIEMPLLYQTVDKTIEFGVDENKTIYSLDNDDSYYDELNNIKCYAYAENEKWFVDLPNLEYEVQQKNGEFYIDMQGKKEKLTNNLTLLYNNNVNYATLQINLSGLSLNILHNIDGNFNKETEKNEKEFFIIINNKKYYVTHDNTNNKYVILLENDYEVSVNNGTSGLTIENIAYFPKDYMVDLLLEPAIEYIIIDKIEYKLIDNAIIYESKKYSPIIYNKEKYVIINNKGYLVQKRENEYYIILNYKKYILTNNAQSELSIKNREINETNKFIDFNVEELTNQNFDFELNFNDLLSNDIIHGWHSGIILTNGYVQYENSTIFGDSIQPIRKYVWVNENQYPIQIVSEEIVNVPILSGVELSSVTMVFLDETNFIDEYYENNITYKKDSTLTISSANTYIINDYSEILFNNNTFITFKNNSNIKYYEKEGEELIAKNILIYKNETIYIESGVTITFQDVTKIKIYANETSVDLFVFNDVDFNNNNELYYPIKENNIINKTIFIKIINADGLKQEQFDINYFIVTDKNNNNLKVNYGYIDNNEPIPFDNFSDKQNIIWEISLPTFNNDIKKYEINNYNLENIEIYNIGNGIQYSKALINAHTNCGDIIIENGIFNFNINSYSITYSISGNSQTTYTSSENDYEFSYNDEKYSIWDYLVNNYVKKLFISSGETETEINLNIQKKITLQNVKYQLDTNKYFLINGDYYLVNENNTITYDNTVYKVVDNQTTITQKCYITKCDDQEKYFVESDIYSFLSHNMKLVFNRNKIGNNIKYFTVSNIIFQPHMEYILIKVQNMNNESEFLYGNYNIKFLK